MKISILTVGKIKEKYFNDAIAEYSKRLSRYCNLEILQVADEKTRHTQVKPFVCRLRRKKASAFSA